MNTSDLAISVKGLQKSFKDKKVLNNVNFEVEKGAIYSLLGSNGAGKTTTIKILTTLARPDAGVINVCQYDVTKEPERVRRVISLTGQYASVDESLTGMENLLLIGRLNHVVNPGKRAAELLDYFDLTDASKRFVSTYSGGMRRKLDIAMGLMNRPEIIFLDEPTTGLDPQSRRSMWKIIKDLNQLGVTIFLTTQYLEEAEQLADRIAILDKGAILVEGTAAVLKGMLPQGILEFTFNDKNSYELALGLTSEYKVVALSDECKMSLYTDGTAEILTRLFQSFAVHGIDVKEFSQKLPTLEDVFLTLIGEKENLK